jgi:hypothetical protein
MFGSMGGSKGVETFPFDILERDSIAKNITATGAALRANQ